MPDDPVGTTVPPRRSETKKVILEAMGVALVGAVFALAANQISPRGLKLTRNYFPGSNSITRASATNLSAPSDAELLAQRLRDNGLRLIELPQVRPLAQDSRTREGLILFIDARNPDSYREGHIPGAWEFDPYHPEKYAASVIPLCQAAQQVIVYCTGGECEDSESAAIALREAGISGEKLFVYGGGITEWKASGLPVEIGEQNSGKLENTKPQMNTDGHR